MKIRQKLAGLMTGFCVLLTGCGTPPKSAEPLDFKRITITGWGDSAENSEIEALKTESGARISYYNGSWAYRQDGSREEDLVSRRDGDAALYQEVTVLLGENGVRGWDGFSKSADGVLDGGGFAMELELPDGTLLTAHGSNAYPAHYYEVWNGLYRLAKEQEDAS